MKYGVDGMVTNNLGSTDNQRFQKNDKIGTKPANAALR